MLLKAEKAIEVGECHHYFIYYSGRAVWDEEKDETMGIDSLGRSIRF